MSIFEFKYQNSHWNNIKNYKTASSTDYHLMKGYVEKVLVHLLTHSKMYAYQYEIGSFDTDIFTTLSFAYPSLITGNERVELQLAPMKFRHDSNTDEEHNQCGFIEHHVRGYSPIEHLFTEEDVTRVETKMFEGYEWSRNTATSVKRFKEKPANVIVVSPPLYFIERSYDVHLSEPGATSGREFMK